MAKTLTRPVEDLFQSGGALAIPLAELEEELQRQGLLNKWLQCVRHIRGKYGMPQGAIEAASQQLEINLLFLKVHKGEFDLWPIQAVDESK